MSVKKRRFSTPGSRSFISAPEEDNVLSLNHSTHPVTPSSSTVVHQKRPLSTQSLGRSIRSSFSNNTVEGTNDRSILPQIANGSRSCPTTGTGLRTSAESSSSELRPSTESSTRGPSPTEALNNQSSRVQVRSEMETDEEEDMVISRSMRNRSVLSTSDDNDVKVRFTFI